MSTRANRRRRNKRRAKRRREWQLVRDTLRGYRGGRYLLPAGASITFVQTGMRFGKNAAAHEMLAQTQRQGQPLRVERVHVNMPHPVYIHKYGPNPYARKRTT